MKKIEDITIQDDIKERVTDCIMFKKNMMLLVLRSRAIMMREDLVSMGMIDFRKSFGPDVVVLFCRPDHSSANGLLFGFFATDSAAESPKFKLNCHSYSGDTAQVNTLVARYTYDTAKFNVVRSTLPKDAVLLEQELIMSALEFAKGKVLLVTSDNRLLLFEQWRCVKIYRDQNVEEMQQAYSLITTLKPLPGFHEVHFPFIVWQKKSGIDIINLRQGKITRLLDIDTGCSNP